MNTRCGEADVNGNVQGALVDMTALFLPVYYVHVEEATSLSAMMEPIVSSPSPPMHASLQLQHHSICLTCARDMEQKVL
jgi:hypothetical protein